MDDSRRNANNDKSILDYFLEHYDAENDKLDDTFILPAAKVSGSNLFFRFVEGAKDGIAVFHEEISDVFYSDEEIDSIKTMCDFVEKSQFIQALQILDKIGYEKPAVKYSKAFYDLIEERMNEDTWGEYVRFTTFVILEAREIESLKYGILVYNLIDAVEPMKLKDELRILAMCDEFTYVIMCGWIAKGATTSEKKETGNQKIFDIAKKVTGWGRIFAICLLKPETEEIRNWILREGYRNDIMYQYTAKLCYEKADIFNRISSMDQADFMCAFEIVESLINEGPVPGISVYSDKDRVIILTKFLEKAASMEFTQDEAFRLMEIYKYSQSIIAEYASENGILDSADSSDADSSDEDSSDSDSEGSIDKSNISSNKSSDCNDDDENDDDDKSDENFHDDFDDI